MDDNEQPPKHVIDEFEHSLITHMENVGRILSQKEKEHREREKVSKHENKD